MANASTKIIDMTNVKEGGRSFNKKRVPEGDYLARVIKVEDSEVKRGDNKGQFQWLFSIKLEKYPTAIYPYYCKLEENQLWKIRNLLVAAGINVPKKKLKLDPEKVVGKLIAVTMEDDEYEGKLQSNLSTIFPPSELEGGADEDEDDEVDDADEEDEDDTEPTQNTRKQRSVKKPAPVDDDDEDEDEDEEEPAPAPKKKKKAKVVEPEPEDDEDEEEEEEEAPKPKKKKRKVSDAELEELDIEDV